MAFAGLSTNASLGAIFHDLSPSTEKWFKGLSVERIYILESYGDLKLVVNNSEKQHAGIVNGKHRNKYIHRGNNNPKVGRLDEEGNIMGK